MEKTKVVSVRLPERLIDELDKISVSNRWWKRNTIIVKALTVFVDCASDKTQSDILRYWESNIDKKVLRFESDTDIRNT